MPVDVLGTPSVSRRAHDILDLFRQVFGREDIALDDNFFELGGDSLLALRLLARANDAYGADLQQNDLFRHPTPRTLARAVDQETVGAGVEGSASLVPLNRARRGLPVFLIPGIAGTPWVFRSLVEQASLTRPVYAPRAPDLDWERDVLSASEMVQFYATTIRSLQRRGPYSIVGYSYGGNLAFDIAIRLVADGQEVRDLVLLDTAAPRPRWRRALAHVRRWVLWKASQLAIGPRVLDALGQQTRKQRALCCFGTGPLTPTELQSILRVAFPEYASRHLLSELSFEELCRTIVQQFKQILTERQFTALTRHAPPEDVVAMIKTRKVWEKNLWLSSLHRPAGVLPGKMTIYVAEGNPGVTGWQRYATQPLDVRNVPTGQPWKRAHGTFLEPPIAALFADDFKRLIDADDADH